MAASSDAEPGRRERKKAATRLALSTAALRLFFERGFDGVTVREIAEAADVSTTTLMKHFPTKEALVFDRDDEIERSIVAAVTERAPGVAVLEALRRHMRERVAFAEQGGLFPKFMKLVSSTPALTDHWRKIWVRHEHALAKVLVAESDRSEPWCRAMAHFVLEAYALAALSSEGTHTVDEAFDILEHGWRGRPRGGE